jgi:peptide/nickel transport system ATP-binding protein
MTVEIIKPLLEVDDLRVDFHTPTGIVNAVRGLSFSIGRERVGIVGESGSGKSMTGRAILDLIPKPGIVSAKKLNYKGESLLSMNKTARRKLRGRRISMVMQDPKYSLNPIKIVGEQIAEAYRVHHRVGKSEARDRALAMLETVHIREPDRVYKCYPHEISGGMGQRVMMAMMLIAEPELLIADEPTSALDVTVQLQILRILDEMVAVRNMGLIFISHDLRLVKSFCDRVIVMYGGRAMETIAAGDLSMSHDLHPYTSGLLQCVPSLSQPVPRLSTLQRDPTWLV